MASVRDIVGGRSAAYEKDLGEARRLAFEELPAEAQRIGANGVVGIDLDYEVVGQSGSMLMVSVSGCRHDPRPGGGPAFRLRSRYGIPRDLPDLGPPTRAGVEYPRITRAEFEQRPHDAL
jgi:hypothetical protein